MKSEFLKAQAKQKEIGRRITNELNEALEGFNAEDSQLINKIVDVDQIN
jgi:hypothetical protein